MTTPQTTEPNSGGDRFAKLSVTQRAHMLRKMAEKISAPLISEALKSTASALELQEDQIAKWKGATQIAMQDRREALQENEELRFKLNELTK